MKVVLLIAHTPNGEVQHRYVAHGFVRAMPDNLAAIIIATGIKRSLGKRIALLWKRYSLRQLASRVAVRIAHKIAGRAAQRETAFRSVLFPDGGGEAMPASDLIRHVPAHNGAQCLALLDELKPDIIVTYGTLIIRKAVIDKAGISMINMHTGLSPIYRGSDTIFWPLHNAEPEYVGVTVHRVDPGIDSGDILATARPLIAADDSVDILFAKAVRAGLPLLIQAARDEYRGCSNPKKQDLAAGREYRSVERTLAAERKVARLLKAGLLRDYLKTQVPLED